MWQLWDLGDSNQAIVQLTSKDIDVSQIKKPRNTFATSAGGPRIMERLARALERLSSTQPSTTHREVFKAPDFTGEGNVEGFI